MDFIFHSVFDDGGKSKYFSVYKIDENHFRAECHHFNRARECNGDFELVRDGEKWKPTDEKFEDEAKFIGEEINRMVSAEDRS